MIRKYLLVVLTVSLLLGMFTLGQHTKTLGVDASLPPSTGATTPESAPTTVPTEPPRVPSYTLQQPVWQKPQKPNVTIPKLSASSYFVYDTRIDEYLAIHGDTETGIYPASTTKLFTTFVALQYLQPNDTVTVGRELVYVESDASVAGFKQGDRVSVEVLAYGTLLPSGCDASYILAAAAGRVILGNEKASAKTAIQAFMTECNRMAKQLGMEHTNFVTPDGYHHDDHKISLQAYVIIGKRCLKDPLIARIAATASVTITYKNNQGKTVSRKLFNSNQTIQSQSDFYNVHAIGLKTGYTSKAGYCLLTAYEVDGRYILVGVFGCRSSDDRFQDANRLFHAYLPYL